MPRNTGQARSPYPPIPSGIRLTHPERVVFDDPPITKADVAAYFAAAAERMLPHVADRPLSVVRCPEGTFGECFFQKHPPVGMPASVRRIKVREKSGWDTYVAVDDVEGLLALVQFGALEVHTWGSRTGDIERPDRIIFDFDPGPRVAWRRVVDAALLVRGMLERIDLKSFVKTTGGKGLHVVVPIAPKFEWPAVKVFCRGVAETLAAARPDEFLSKMTKAARTGRIFVDYLRNERGATAVAPYSTRARPGCPIAMPVAWRELGKLSGGDAFDWKNAAKRLTARAIDPWRGIDKLKQKLPKHLSGGA